MIEVSTTKVRKLLVQLYIIIFRSLNIEPSFMKCVEYMRVNIVNNFTWNIIYNLLGKNKSLVCNKNY